MPQLDKEEKEMLNSAERGAWRSVPNAKAEMHRFQRYARSTFLKDRRVNIRLSSQELQGIRKRALEEGIPYQTLIASLIHKYVTGVLVEKRA